MYHLARAQDNGSGKREHEGFSHLAKPYSDPSGGGEQLADGGYTTLLGNAASFSGHLLSPNDRSIAVAPASLTGSQDCGECSTRLG